MPDTYNSTLDVGAGLGDSGEGLFIQFRKDRLAPWIATRLRGVYAPLDM